MSKSICQGVCLPLSMSTYLAICLPLAIMYEPPAVSPDVSTNKLHLHVRRLSFSVGNTKINQPCHGILEMAIN